DGDNRVRCPGADDRSVVSRRRSRCRGGISTPLRLEIACMKTTLTLCGLLVALATGMNATAQPSPGGSVYGPKGAFNISAPKGWSLDPTAGSEQGLPCVLYPRGAT